MAHTSSTPSAGRLTPRFRQDINGLRAYAVMAVLLYHFGVGGVTGGYAGVDIFFVISGFLMTAIILPAVESGRFSLASFYLARVRRIFPALLALCLVVLLFGWFWLAPYLYESLGRSAGSSLLFFSNFTYNRAGGYFAEPAHNNWLLHTWSVSVEWQFYLLYPLLLLALAKWLPRARSVVLASLLVVLVASFATSCYLTEHKPTSAFFLLPSRAWELLAGSLVFLASSVALPGSLRRLFELTGFGMIAATIFLVDSTTPWPGQLAILPVIGTCLIILAAQEQSWLTANLPAQYLGRWSYSIYLWHWPLVVGLGYFGFRDNWVWVTAAMAASIALGGMSFALIEKPSAAWMRGNKPQKNWIYTGIAFTAVFSVAAFAYFDHGVARTFRLSPEILLAANGKEDTSDLSKCNKPESHCVLGSGKTRVFVWGDSHAIASVEAVAEVAKSADGSIIFFGQQSCPVIFDAISSNRHSPNYCADFNAMVFNKLQQESRDTPVLIIHRAGAYTEPGERLMSFDGPPPANSNERFNIYRKHMIDSLCRIAGSNPVYVLLPIPVMPHDVPAVLVKSLILTGQAETGAFVTPSDFQDESRPVVDALHEAAARCNIRLLDPTPYFCTESTCAGVTEGVPLYSDDNHLTRTGARRLKPLYKTLFNAVP